MRIYDNFCQSVSDAVRNATRQEQAAIRQELLEHLQDHAADLMEAQGLSEEDAAEAAVAAMGDAKEIGRALSEKYPAWPNEAAFTMRILIAVLCLLLFYSVAFHQILPLDSLTARFSPEHAFAYPDEAFQNAQEADYRWTLNGQVYRVYRMGLATGENKNHEPCPVVQVWICNYNQNPFLNCAGSSMQRLQFRSEDGTLCNKFQSHASHGSSRAYYTFQEIPVSAEDSIFTISLGSNGKAFSVEIPFPESEVQP